MKRDANRLRMLRAERRLTQMLLSRKSGIHASRISLIENGLAEPKPKERDRLARALKVAVAEAFPESEAVAL
jgi:transcriptional regulator with XRE-family HTH domain